MFRRVAAWCLSLFRRPVGPDPLPSLAPEQSLERLRLQINWGRQLLVKKSVEARQGHVTVGLRLLLFLAVVGLVLSFIVHVAALLGQPQPLGAAAWGLHIGVFVVVLPTVAYGSQLAKGFTQKSQGKAALRGCPPWVGRMTTGLAGYVVVSMAILLVVQLVLHPPAGGPRRPPDRGTVEVAKEGFVEAWANAPRVGFWIFSAGWMLFYWLAVAGLYSALVVAKQDPARRCPNGHRVLPSDANCETCGASVPEPGPTESTSTPVSLPLAGGELDRWAAQRPTKDSWPFNDPENVAALTVRQVIHGGQPILLVFHDAHDGRWLFLTGGPVEKADLLIVSLREVYRIDPSIAELADLPLGWHASRRSAEGPWQRHASG